MSVELSPLWVDVEWDRREVLHDEPYPDGDGFRPAGSVVVGVKARKPDGTQWGQSALMLPPITPVGEASAKDALCRSLNELL